MIKKVIIIRSSISSSLLKYSLFRGSLIAFVGVLILIFAGSFLPLNFLSEWGWILFFISLGLITLGLLPYRRLSRLQLKPNELILLDPEHIAFFHRGRKLLTLPLQSIAEINYISHSRIYGIAIKLKANPAESIIVHHGASKEIESMRRLGEQMGKKDLFFSYFNQRAYDELLDITSIED